MATLKLKRPAAPAPERPRRPAVRGGPRGARPTLAEAQRARAAAAEAEAQRTRAAEPGAQRTRATKAGAQRSRASEAGPQRPHTADAGFQRQRAADATFQRPRPAERPLSERPSPKHPVPTAPHADGSLRLSKRMSELGIASRREADEWIARGWVRVDGRVVSELGARVVAGQHITVDAKARREQSGRVTVLLNKPVGYVSGQAEDGHRPAVVLVTPQNQWREDRSGTRFAREHLRSLVPAGRLDIDSVGLLVLTQDGRVARQLVGEDGEIEKEYLVRVARAAGAPLRPDALALLRHGLALDGVALRPAQVEWINADQLRFVLREGRKRQIRRMCEAVGLQVLGLKRVRIGAVALGDLPPGQWRYLRADEAFAAPPAQAPTREPSVAGAAAAPSETHAASAEQPDQPDHDQVDRDDVAEQPRHDQDQHAGDQRDQRADVQGQVHRRDPD